MKNNYVARIDDTLRDYIEKLIKNNPDDFASDGANNRLVKKYFEDVCSVDVHNYVATKVHSITRIKSKFLEANPFYDRRIKEKGNNTLPSNDGLNYEES